MNKYFKEIIVVLFLILLYATNPAKPLHLSVIQDEILVKKEGLNQESYQYLKRLGNTNFDVESYIFFSKTICTIKEEYHVVGIGFLGHVFLISNINEILNNPENPNKSEESVTATEEVSTTWEPAFEGTPTN